MSDTPQPEAPKEQSPPNFLGVGLGTIITSATSLLTGLLGSGPWGIAAVALASIAGIFGYNFLIGSWNKRVDKGDQDRAGADAGNTATDLVNQIGDNESAIDRQRKINPPTKG